MIALLLYAVAVAPCPLQDQEEWSTVDLRYHSLSLSKARKLAQRFTGPGLQAGNLLGGEELPFPVPGEQPMLAEKAVCFT